MRTLKHYLLLTLLLLTLTPVATLAQAVGDFTYSHLGLPEGMLSQRIYTIVQTRDGALWWATKNSVERYNGVSIHPYLLGDQQAYDRMAGRYFKLTARAGGAGHGLPDARQLLAFDNKGGIYAYDAPRDSFCLQHDVSQLTGGYIVLNDVLATAHGLWLACSEGIYFLAGDRLTCVARDIHANSIVTTGRRVLFCTKQGLLSYDGGEQQPPRANSPLRRLLDAYIESGYYDAANHRLWLGGFTSGLWTLTTDHQEATVSQQQLTLDTPDRQNPIRCIRPYDEQTMLVGIDGKGVYRVSRQPLADGRHASHLLFDANEGRHGVLHGNGVYALLVDSWANIIIGTYSGGIDIARPVGSTSDVFQHSRNDQQSILNDRVNCVAQLTDDVLCMGTDDGVSLLNTKTDTWTHTCHGAVVLSLCKTPQGNILAATYGKGVYEITPAGQARQRYSQQGGPLTDDHVYKLCFDRDGHLWMGCLDGQLVQQTADGFRYHDVRYVRDLVQLPDGRMAVATTYGVQLVSPSTGKITALPYHVDGQQGDVNKFVQCLYVHAQKELWLGTDGGGVYVYHLPSGKCRQLTIENGLPSNSVSSISHDPQGRIMVATEQGLSFVEPARPSVAINANYCQDIEREYSNGAVVLLRSGLMLFGTTSGALVINPAKVQRLNYSAQLRLLTDTDDDTLYRPYDDRSFDLNFECINLRNQFDIAYQYRVGDGPWSQPFSEQYIRFTNLEPGSHQLVLRSVSRSCGQVLDEQLLTIVIGQPWWNTWWMWLVYLLLLLLAFYGAWRVYQLHTKYMRLVVSSANASMSPASSDTSAAASSIGDDGAARHADTAPDDHEAAGDRDHANEFIEKATKLVADHLADPDFNIDRLCREMAMSRTLFYVKLKSYTGKSPQDFIRVIRLERAAALLRAGRPVADAAALSGFDNPKYFSTVFKKYFGVSPSKYQ